MLQPVVGAVHGPEAALKYNKSDAAPIYLFIYREWNILIPKKHTSHG